MIPLERNKKSKDSLNFEQKIKLRNTIADLTKVITFAYRTIWYGFEL